MAKAKVKISFGKSGMNDPDEYVDKGVAGKEFPAKDESYGKEMLVEKLGSIKEAIASDRKDEAMEMVDKCIAKLQGKTDKNEMLSQKLDETLNIKEA